MTVTFINSRILMENYFKSFSMIFNLVKPKLIDVWERVSEYWLFESVLIFLVNIRPTIWISENFLVSVLVNIHMCVYSQESEDSVHQQVSFLRTTKLLENTVSENSTDSWPAGQSWLPSPRNVYLDNYAFTWEKCTFVWNPTEHLRVEPFFSSPILSTYPINSL